MKTCSKNTMRLGALMAVMMISVAAVHAQNRDKDKAPAKVGGEGGAMKGGMAPMGGQGGVT